MKDFSLFEITDFVLDEDFIRWVTGTSEADKHYWENWLKRNPHKHLIVAEARRILEAIGTERTAVPPAIIDLEIEKVLQAINLRSEPPVVDSPVYRSFSGWKYAAAAIVIMAVLGVSAWLFTGEEESHEVFAYKAITSSRQLVENVNNSKNMVTIPLPDGSTVKLASNSRISYDSRFDSLQTRDVYLSGQAFFNVKKNPHRPFRVFANEIVAKVLGTSFTVRSFEKDTVIQVTVSTGKVSVYSQGQTNIEESSRSNILSGIIVTPNQQLVYEKSSQGFQKILLEKPVMISAVPVNKTMAYEDAPVDKVFADLGRDYGIEIVYDNEILNKCTVTADLSNETFYHKLDLICRALGARYEVINAQIVIQADGCQ